MVRQDSLRSGNRGVPRPRTPAQQAVSAQVHLRLVRIRALAIRDVVLRVRSWARQSRFESYKKYREKTGDNTSRQNSSPKASRAASTLVRVARMRSSSPDGPRMQRTARKASVVAVKLGVSKQAQGWEVRFQGI